MSEREKADKRQREINRYLKNREEREHTVTKKMYKAAIELVRDTDKASASYIQRIMRLDYSQAAKLIELMEGDELIGKAEGSKPREVYQENITEYIENDWINHYHPDEQIKI